MREQPDLQQDIEAIKRDLQSLKLELGNLLKDSLEAGQQSARDVADRTTDTVRETARATSDRARASIDCMEEKVRERPLSSVVFAMIAGMIMGALLLRQRD